MKEFKGTPGPWVIFGSVPEEGVDCFWIRAQPHPAMRGFSKEIGTVNGFQHDKQATANAYLVAAAPDLLDEHQEWALCIGKAYAALLQGDQEEAKQIIYDLCTVDFSTGEPVAVSPAIAKALGEDHG